MKLNENINVNYTKLLMALYLNCMITALLW